MCIPMGTGPITVVMEFAIPLFLHNLGNPLLYQSIQNGRGTQLAFASIRFGDFHSQDGFWAVDSFHQLLPVYRPVLFQKM